MPPLSRGSKIFHYHTSNPYLPFHRSSIFSIFCLIVGIVGLIVAIAASHRSRFCDSFEPRSVSVVWERGDNALTPLSSGGEDVQRHKVMGFVGIFTGFGSVGRRRSLRETWFPSDEQGLEKLEEATGLAFRFIIGRTSDSWKMSQLKYEVAEYDDFLLLDIQEQYNKLPYKTLAFFRAAYALFDSEFYVKIDDDIYLRPDRLSLLLARERSNPRTYIGCFKKGAVFTNPRLKWYEPLSHLLGPEYFLHAYGPIYALSASVVRSLGALRNESVRMFNNEDVTLGSWMLAMNVKHEHEKMLCETRCTESFIAVWDLPKCSGLCNPEMRMLELHKMDACSKTPTVRSFK